ncbi:MAG TPA: RsmE family RNA methyltransferase [Thermodesulfobacteriota bacterium]|nr:RsmE family RNA methyltransferase [Thermodesulfobacteriota bacterium]
MHSTGQIIFDKKLSLGEELVAIGANNDNLLLWNLRKGGAVTISDSDARLFRARVVAQGKTSSTLLVFEDTGFRKNILRVTLFQALPEKERMELIIQKTIELGVNRVIPFKSEKSTTIEERDLKQKKSNRWKDIALKAAKQSRRPDIPEIAPYCSFKEALSFCDKTSLKIMLKQGSGIMSLKEFFKTIPPFSKGAGLPLQRSIATGSGGIMEAALLVGPEGGLSEEEVKEAEKAGFICVSLGSNILRVETAAIIGVGIVRYELGA